MKSVSFEFFTFLLAFVFAIAVGMIVLSGVWKLMLLWGLAK